MNVVIPKILGVVRELLGVDPGDEPSEEPLPAALKVLRLLEHEGPVRQRHIAESFGWSASKTSRLLRSMEAEGLIERRYISREKAVYLPDQINPPIDPRELRKSLPCETGPTRCD